ncbi:uncharacterized protein [Onthophagus taurus]|uniref:uncharacterized protein n=1 Tax=Onthophagus taurus TaxID=166361 RepID=UPI000C1FE77F|nr:uncharacterized protein LOC111426652 [Onthophagus taurus]XP_022917039.1 uncharacterized protein LOC111426652 [Onthophagus taurus]
MKVLVFGYFLLIQIVSNHGFPAECAIKVSSFAYSEDTHDGYIVWEQVSSECTTDPHYRVKYKIGDSEEIGVSPLPYVQMAIIPLQSVTCEQVEAQVYVIVNGEIAGMSIWVKIMRELGKVKELKATQSPQGVVVEWDPINLGENCDETYLFQYKIDGAEVEQKSLVEPNILIELIDDTPCTNIEIQVVAKINGFSSKQAEIIYEIKIPPVENVILSNNNGRVLVDFNRITVAPAKCGDFDYRVTFEDLGCFNTSFQVLPVSKLGTEGTAVTQEIVRQPGVVINPTITKEGDEIVLNWSPPKGAEDCNMMYLIEIDKKISSTPLTTLQKYVELESCVEEKIAKITPVVIYNQFDDVQGISVDVPIEAELKEVANLVCELNSNSVTCTWDKPNGSDNCEKIIYKLSYYNGQENHEDVEVTDFNFELIKKEFCVIWFHVQPIAYFNGKEYQGKIKEADITGCST